MEKTIYTLNLHETLDIDEALTHGLYVNVMRVPGGWIYRTFGQSDQGTFVPFSKEFVKMKNHSVAVS